MLGRNLHLCFSLIRRPLSHEPTAHESHRDRPISSPPSDTATTTTTTTFDDTATSSTDSEPADIPAATPDFAAALASQRLFFSAPGRSNSIVDSSPEICSGGGSVAVPTYSPDPYSDFRRSMEEMVAARGGAWDWEYLHELLLCYLALNPKSAHNIIIGAFSDLLVGLMPPLPESVRRR